LSRTSILDARQAAYTPVTWMFVFILRRADAVPAVITAMVIRAEARGAKTPLWHQRKLGREHKRIGM
jgi:hypothetical protein